MKSNSIINLHANSLLCGLEMPFLDEGAWDIWMKPNGLHANVLWQILRRWERF
jgi:hypothetical protein